MSIDPWYREHYRELAEVMRDNPTEQEVRELLRESVWRQELWTSPDVVSEDLAIPGPHGSIPVRTYRPVHGRRPGRALLWVHGGGFLDGDLDMHEAHMVSGELAKRADAFVVSVDYRLARDGVRYPVPLDDVHAAWSWLCAHGMPTELRNAPIALGGASAGAALALATALRDRDNGQPAVDILLLAYPFAHFPVPALDDATAAEMSALPAMGRFTPLGIEHMVRNYVGRISGVPADALPGAARLDGLPPTRILLSEYDDLRPSGELLHRQLDEVGVPVTTYLAKGMLHGHLNINASLPEVEASLDYFADSLREAEVHM